MLEKCDYSILFIEDEEDIRKNYITYLKRYFKNIYEASSAKNAYDIYLDKKPDILIIDINLPDDTGLNLLKKIRQKDHKTKAIMLTAYSETNYLLEAAELKLSKYLIKPVSRGDLKESLDLAINEIIHFSVKSNKILSLAENYTWDFNKEELFQNTQKISLTNKETQILNLLFSNLNISLSYDEIIIHIWDTFEKDKLDALKTLIKKLRKKLPKDTIENIYGHGYKIRL